MSDTNPTKNTTQKTKAWAIQTQLNTENEYRFPKWHQLILLKYNPFFEINSREHMVDGCTPTCVVNFYRHVDDVLQYNMTCHGANTYCWKWRLTLAHSLAEVKSAAQLLARGCFTLIVWHELFSLLNTLLWLKCIV